MRASRTTSAASFSSRSAAGPSVGHFSPATVIREAMAEPGGSLRAYFYDLLEETEHTSPLEESIKLFLCVAAVGTVAAAALETMESLRAAYALHFSAVEILAVALFTLDYFLRWWVAPESEATGA